MESVIKQLVKIGHGMGAEVANDEPAVAKLLVELSSALDVQYERANAQEAKCAALAAELKQRQIDAGCYKKGMEASNERLVQVAAENAGLAAEVQSVKAMNDCLSEELRGYESDGAFEGPKMHLLWWKVQTPATDSFLAEVRAQGVESLLTESFRADIAGALADFDGMDEASLNTLIWSGQPPEPDGDVWCVEYMTRAAAVQRKVREYAARIRKGAAE